MLPSYSEKVSTSEVLQVFVEGVDQLELYFGKYLPQFFFAMLAPITPVSYTHLDVYKRQDAILAYLDGMDSFALLNPISV